MANRKSMGVWVGVMVGVAIAAAIVMTVALDVDQTTRDVTTYEYVTTTTGLFEYDKTPQYIDYDLSKNYTGYYTSASDPYWGGVGTNGDGYYASEQVNRYPLNLAPTSTIDEDKDLSSATLTDVNPPDPDQIFRVTIVENGQSSMESKPHIVALNDVLSYYGVSGYSTLSISTEAGMALAQQSDLTHITTSQIIGLTGYYVQYVEDMNANPTWTFLGETYQSKQLYRSCTVNMINGTTTLYANADFTGTTLFIETANLCIIYHHFSGDFGTTIHLDGKELPPAQYLDISKGVRVSP